MGRLLIFFSSLPIILGCSDAPLIPLVPTNRVVLVELFTWQRCVYCPYAAHTLDSLKKEFSDSVVVVAYHRRVVGDTFSPTYVEERRAFYYESGGEPATVFDGGPVVRTPGPEYNYETFKNSILGAKSVLPGVEMALTVQSDSSRAMIEVFVLGVDSTPQESLRLFLVITEDSLSEALPGATDSVFNDVMRAMLPDVNGLPCKLRRGDTLRFEQTVVFAPYWESKHLKVVSFVQLPSTRRVLQACWKKI
ncbi:MAG: hypothetical protein ACUVUD_04435 [bacterium]